MSKKRNMAILPVSGELLKLLLFLPKDWYIDDIRKSNDEVDVFNLKIEDVSKTSSLPAVGAGEIIPTVVPNFFIDYENNTTGIVDILIRHKKVEYVSETKHSMKTSKSTTERFKAQRDEIVRLNKLFDSERDKRE